MLISSHVISVCSWSLRAKNTAELASQIKQLGLEHVQLAPGPLVGMNDRQRREEIAPLKNAGIAFSAGMFGFADEDYTTIATIRQTGGFVPDKLWPERKRIAVQAAHIAAELGIKLLAGHVGFVPESDHVSYGLMVTRMCEVATAFADAGVDLLMETGQEEATELLRFINDLSMPNVFVNFDPANMILYGAGDPIEAIRVLGRHIKHVHVKDAKLSDEPAVRWGEEVPFGTGQVGAKAFVQALNSVGYKGALCIEREAGETRVQDVKAAIEALRGAA